MEIAYLAWVANAPIWNTTLNLSLGTLSLFLLLLLLPPRSQPRQHADTWDLEKGLSETSPYHASTDGIWITRTIEQTSEEIPYDLSRLLQPPLENESWLSCLVPAQELEDGKWAYIRHLPPIKVITKRMVAVRESIIPWLVTNGFPLAMAIPHNITYPTHKAAEKARFLRTIVGLVRSTPNDAALYRYLRSLTTDRSLQVPIESSILTKAIKDSKGKDRSRLLLRYMLWTLVSAHNLTDNEALEILNREEDTWMRMLSQLDEERTRCPLENWEKDMSDISQIYDFVMLEESAGLRWQLIWAALHNQYDGPSLWNALLQSEVLQNWTLKDRLEILSGVSGDCLLPF